MDPWQMFAYLSKVVVENQNVFLDVVMTNGMIEFQLLPIDCYEEEDDTDNT